MKGARERLDRRLTEGGGLVETLRLPAWLYGGLVRMRARLYDLEVLPRARLEVPVISVGNLTVGGTGKTPFVQWLVRHLAARGLRAGVLSRGYRAGKGGGAGSERRNDEGAMLARALPDVPQVQDPDRVAGGLELIRRGAELIVLDDGFQHRRLRRDVDVVLVDAMRPWGLPAGPAGAAPVRALLPRGLLREPLSALRRADLLVITRSDQVSADELDALRAALHRAAPGPALALASHRAVGLRPIGPPDDVGEAALPSALRGRSVDLISGIGNPEGFEASVRALGAHVREHRAFPDHHAYRAGDLDGLGEDGRWLLTTAKDAVKLEPLGGRGHVLEVEFALVEGRAVLEALVDALPTSRGANYRRALHGGLHG